MHQRIVEGYAPPNLIRLVRGIAWETISPMGKCFPGIKFGEIVLLDAVNSMNIPFHFGVRVSEVPQGRKFEVDGFTLVDILDPSQDDAVLYAKIADYFLLNLTMSDLYKVHDFLAYRLSVEKL